MNLRNPDARRALRSVVEALAALALVALLYWLVSLLRGTPDALTGIARGCLIIIGLNALMYGAENVTRAIKLTGPAGFGAEFGSDTAPTPVVVTNPPTAPVPTTATSAPTGPAMPEPPPGVTP